MLARLLVIAAAVAGFFPWVSFNLNSFDTQPWFLLLGLLFLLTSARRFPVRELPIWAFIPASVIVLLWMHEDDALHTARGIATYCSAAVALLVFDRYLRLVPLRRRRSLLAFTTLAWVLFPVLQAANMAPALVVGRTDELRGFTSLAAEPTFFGLFSLAMIAILFLEREQWREANAGRGGRLYLLLALMHATSIVLVARSSMAILLGLLLGGVWLVLYRPRWALGLALAGGLGLLSLDVYVDTDGLSDSRIRPLQVLALVIDQPRLILAADASINDRVSHMVLSVSLAFGDFLAPHGVSAFMKDSAVASQGSILIGSNDNKIMSFIGGFLYELGPVSLLYLHVLAGVVMVQRGLRRRLLVAIALGTVLLTAVPVGFPLVGYVVALLHLGGCRAAASRRAGSLGPEQRTRSA